VPGALDGILVADFSRVLAGPLAAMVLGDLGADVIKVERPGTGDDTRAWGPPWTDDGATYYLGLNRNKRSVVLDLEDSNDRSLGLRLASRADIVIESFRPGRFERFGFGHDAIAAVNPGVITCSVSAFGRDEPGASLPGYDLLLQAMGGLMSVTGEPGGRPLRTGAAVVDLVCGLSATIGILGALHARDVHPDGHGQHVDATLMDAALTALLNQGSGYLLAGVVPGLIGNRHPSIVPYSTYDAADGTFVLAVGNDALFARLIVALERPRWVTDGRFATNEQRAINIEALDAELRPLFAAYPRNELVELLRAAGVPAGPVNNVAEAFAFAEELGLEPMTEVDGMRLMRPPVRLTGTPESVRLAPPTLDEHGDEIRAWLRGGG